MRRCIPVVLAIGLGAVLAACGGDDTLSPRDRMIAPGTYAYEGRFLHPVRAEWDTIRGSLEVGVVTPDSIHGSWNLPGFRRDSTGGHWNENAYVVRAISNNGRVTVNTRLWRIGSPSQPSCALGYREEPVGQNPVVTSGTCDVLLTP